jgi:hypothetical protein
MAHDTKRQKLFVYPDCIDGWKSFNGLQALFVLNFREILPGVMC